MAGKLAHDYVAVMERLLTEVEQYGEQAFAEALEQCLLSSTGGTVPCPVAQLYCDLYLQDGILPQGRAPRPNPRDPGAALPMHPLSPRQRMERIQAIFMRQATLQGDASFAKALHACAHARVHDTACAMQPLITIETRRRR